MKKRDPDTLSVPLHPDTLSVPLHPNTVDQMTRALRKRLRWVKHTHLLEALACALGMSTYLALRERVLRETGGPDARSRASINVLAFVSRLRELGHTGPEHAVEPGILESLNIWWLTPKRENPNERRRASALEDLLH